MTGSRKVVLYSRVSTDHQTNENQLRELRAYAERMNYRTIAELSDHGISGSKGRRDRPAYNRLLQMITRKEVLTDVIQLPSDDIEEDAYSIVPILFVPPRMLTRNRIAPLLAITGEISMRIVIDPDTDDILISIGIPDDVFDAATDSELMDVISLFRGLEDQGFHSRLLAILKRSLN